MPLAMLRKIEGLRDVRARACWPRLCARRNAEEEAVKNAVERHRCSLGSLAHVTHFQISRHLADQYLASSSSPCDEGCE